MSNVSLVTKFQACYGSKPFDTLMVFPKEFFVNVNFENNQQTTKKHAKLPSMLLRNKYHLKYHLHISDSNDRNRQIVTNLLSQVLYLAYLRNVFDNEKITWLSLAVGVSTLGYLIQPNKCTLYCYISRCIDAFV